MVRAPTLQTSIGRSTGGAGADEGDEEGEEEEAAVGEKLSAEQLKCKMRYQGLMLHFVS